jgi:hypothetical protein
MEIYSPIPVLLELYSWGHETAKMRKSERKEKKRKTGINEQKKQKDYIFPVFNAIYPIYFCMNEKERVEGNKEERVQ